MGLVYWTFGLAAEDLRNVQVHGLVALATCALLHEARVAAFDLDAAACFLLDVLNVGASLTYDLGSEIEAWERL